VAWFTAPKEVSRSNIAFSHDGGRTFGPPVRVDDVSSLGRMSVALAPDGSAVVGWIEVVGEKSQFKVRRIQPNGTRLPPVTVADVTGTRIPRLAIAKDEVTLAWTESEKDSSHVKTARIHVGSN
jgi:hypothetical protein